MTGIILAIMLSAPGWKPSERKVCLYTCVREARRDFDRCRKNGGTRQECKAAAKAARAACKGACKP